jgi:hypothetical protein
MLAPGFAPFWQLAWVTPDLERSMEQFRTIYNVPSFFVMEPVFNAVFNGEQGSMSIRMALANIDIVPACRRSGRSATPAMRPTAFASPIPTSVHLAGFTSNTSGTRMRCGRR